jgi:hypothetical protein
MKKLVVAVAVLATVAGCDGRKGRPGPVTDKVVKTPTHEYKVGHPRDSTQALLDALRYKDQAACKKILTDGAYVSAAGQGFDTFRRRVARMCDEMQRDTNWLLAVDGHAATVRSRGWHIHLVFDIDMWRVDAVDYKKTRVLPE